MGLIDTELLNRGFVSSLTEVNNEHLKKQNLLIIYQECCEPATLLTNSESFLISPHSNRMWLDEEIGT